MDLVGNMAADQWRDPSLDCEEARLVRLDRAGDRAAFEALVRQHTPQVTSVARRFISDSSELKDVVQETFVRA